MHRCAFLYQTFSVLLYSISLRQNSANGLVLDQPLRFVLAREVMPFSSMSALNVIINLFVTNNYIFGMIRKVSFTISFFLS